MELSKRLQAVASLVDRCGCVADIGTDHAYVPIDLVRRGIASRAIAMDVHEGPLGRAACHVRGAGLEGKIELRLSDGLEKLSPGEADQVIMAGMGGALVTRILKGRMEVARDLEACVLQPQSEISKVRAFLLEEGFLIIEEQMVREDGKYYPMMRVLPPGKAQKDDGKWDEVQLRFGKRLLEDRHPVLKEFLKKNLRLTRQIMDGLPKGGGERVEERRAGLCLEMEHIRRGLEYYDGRD